MYGFLTLLKKTYLGSHCMYCFDNVSFSIGVLNFINFCKNICLIVELVQIEYNPGIRTESGKEM